MNKSLHILHIEDDPDYGAFAREMFAKERWPVDLVLAGSFLDFMAALEKGQFGIILADYELPTCSGMEALQAARQKCPDTANRIIGRPAGPDRMARPRSGRSGSGETTQPKAAGSFAFCRPGREFDQPMQVNLQVSP